MADSLKTIESLQILRDERRLPRIPDPNAVVIFGASGDLTARKLVPALYDLAAQRRLPMEFAVVGVSRTKMSHDVVEGGDEFASREVSGGAEDYYGVRVRDPGKPSLVMQDL